MRHAEAPKENSLARAVAATVPPNRLLAKLADGEGEPFRDACEPVELAAGQALEPGRYAYFPLDAVVSLGVGPAGSRRAFEVALVGREGMVGVPLLFDAQVPALRTTVVRPGAALRIAAAPLRQQLLVPGSFSQSVQHYVVVALAQLAQAALCTRYHGIEQRLARWLLAMQDLAPDDRVQATHEFLAGTLGVRRAGVSRAAASLQQRHLIAYHRGVLVLTDRAGLQAAACACYEADRASYAAVMDRPG